jgi:4-hydroxy-2-oxoheptanedioate aldolase
VDNLGLIGANTPGIVPQLATLPVRIHVRTNEVKRRLKDGDVIVGVGLSLGSVRSAEIFAAARCDFLMVDLQHGHYDKAGATNALRSIAATDCVPFARVGSNDPARINDVLDSGALGVVVPMINAPDQAEAAVRAAYYHPQGERSRGSLSTVVYGDDYGDQANGNIAVVLMLETPEAIRNARSIVSVKGVDCLLIGPSDLSLSMGCSTRDPRFMEAVDSVVAAAKEAGVAAGIAVSGAEEAELWIRRGLTFFLATHDTALLKKLAVQFMASFQPLRIGRDR